MKKAVKVWCSKYKKQNKLFQSNLYLFYPCRGSKSFFIYGDIWMHIIKINHADSTLNRSSNVWDVLAFFSFSCFRFPYPDIISFFFFKLKLLAETLDLFIKLAPPQMLSWEFYKNCQKSYSKSISITSLNDCLRRIQFIKIFSVTLSKYFLFK